MTQAAAVISSLGPAAGSLYDHVGLQIRDLASRFDLAAKQAQISQAYETLCKESLDMPSGRRPPEFSRINEDGTPFQYALTMAPGGPSPLQFLSEAGIPGSSMSDRVALSRRRINTLCSLLGLEGSRQQLCSLMDRFAPKTGFEMQTDDAGAFWIGIRFSPDAQAKLIVYVNGKWGSADGRWARANEFAACLGALEVWRGVESLFGEGMEPLGLALTVSQDRPITGRIYATSYGKSVAFYERVVRSLNQTGAGAVLGKFAEIMLGDERRYPVRSAVCSVGLNQQSEPDFKLELCGHCMFSSDVDAIARCHRWLDAAKADPSRYQDLLRVIASGPFSSTRTHLHSYVGFGWKDHELYTSIYLKPQILSTSGELS
jgi:hypothetical protein